MFKFCVFDMDGTVVNSLGDIASAMNRSLEELGYNTYDEDDYKSMVGDGMRVLCQRAIPNEGEEAVDKLVAEYNKNYLDNICVKSFIYDGVEELVRKLGNNGVKCAILSNKPQPQALEVADKLFYDGMFVQVLGQTPQFPVKPAPDSLLWMMKHYGFDKSEVAYIGDSNVDVRLGKAADVYTVGVEWGFRGAEELKFEGADDIAKDTDELAKLLGLI